MACCKRSGFTRKGCGPWRRPKRPGREFRRAPWHERRRSANSWCKLMNSWRTEAIMEARRPLASLIRKSEKARRHLAPGSWQHAMLQANLKALHMAFDLMRKARAGAKRATAGELREALQAMTSMIGRTRKAQAYCAPGTSPHTLLRNRLKALRIAKALLQMESARRKVPGASGNLAVGFKRGDSPKRRGANEESEGVKGTARQARRRVYR